MPKRRRFSRTEWLDFWLDWLAGSALSPITRIGYRWSFYVALLGCAALFAYLWITRGL